MQSGALVGSRVAVRLSVRAFVVGAASAALGACGSSSNGGSAAPKDPVVACNDFRDAVCATEQRCGSMLTPDECKADLLAQGLDCPSAIAVSASYDQCLSETKSAQCSGQLTPASCHEVITIGVAPPAQGTLSSCFAPSDTLNSCDAFCASVGLKCTSSCAIFQGVPPMFAGIDWQTAGLCPAADQGLAVPDCALALSTSKEVRCCCSP